MRRGKTPLGQVILFEILCGFSIAGAVLFPARVFADSIPISEAEFWEKLQQTRDLVDGLRNSPQAEVCAVFQDEAETWAAVSDVQLVSGTVIPVHTDWLIAGLRKCPPEVDLLLGRINALLDAADSRRTSGSPSAFDAGQLQDILSQEEFKAHAESAPKEDPLQSLWNSFQKWLMAAANQVHLPTEFIWIAGLFTTALLLAILFLAFRMFRRNITQQVDAGSADALAPGFLTSVQAMEFGRKKSLSGNRRLAIRYLYLSAILFLEEQGYLTYNRSLTNQEYVRSIAHLPHLAAPLQRIVNVFDRVWYGFQIPSEKEYRDYLDLVNGIRRNL
jgi:hypothetical protein